MFCYIYKNIKFKTKTYFFDHPTSLMLIEHTLCDCRRAQTNVGVDVDLRRQEKWMHVCVDDK